MRLQHEQFAHQETVRWLDDKRALYRDLLIAMHGWHDGIAAMWQGEPASDLIATRTTAYRLGVEADLIALPQTRAAIGEARRGLFAVQAEVVLGLIPPNAGDPCVDVKQQLQQMENALRAELSRPTGRGNATAVPQA
ncbi:hypothetical protein [Streptomyces sp. SPB162]|uniref:hypothetical protein n=1 Tax=Streptomyces sp. SPB162 TaxID=2940560 RepID=UPI00240524C2|nr:hypothetical protein [Streptomyces sp. SPB162]